MLRLLAPAVHRAELPDLQGLQKPGVHQGRQLQGAHHAAELEAHAVDAGAGCILHVRDVQEQEDRRCEGREGRCAAGAAVRSVQQEEAQRRFPEGAVERKQQAWKYPEMLRLLAPAVHGGELPDVQEVQGPAVHEGLDLQRGHHAAELKVHAVHAGASRVFSLRELPAAGVFTLQTVKSEGGLFERAAQQQQPTGPPLEVHRLLPPAVRRSGAQSETVQNVLRLPRRGVQWKEKELQGRRRGPSSETDASVAGCGELLLVLQLQFYYLCGQELRRPHLRQGCAEEEPRSFEREEKRLHLRRLPDRGEDEEVARRRHGIEMKSSRAAEWNIALFCGLCRLREQRLT